MKQKQKIDLTTEVEITNEEDMTPSLKQLLINVGKHVLRQVNQAYLSEEPFCKEEDILDSELQGNSLKRNYTDKEVEIVNKLFATPYFVEVIDYINSILNYAKCKVVFTPFPVGISETTGKAFAVKRYSAEHPDLDDETKTVYFYTVDFLINIDYKNGIVPEVKEQDFLKSFVFRCFIE